MTLLLLVALALATCVSMVGLARASDARTWRRHLRWYRLLLPSGMSEDDVTRWLAGIAAITHAPRGFLLVPPPLVLEVVATAGGIEHSLGVPSPMEGAVLAGLRAALPGARLEQADRGHGSNAAKTVMRLGAAVRLAGRERQMAVERAAASNQALLAALQPLGGGERICWQWIIVGAGTPPPLPPVSQQAELAAFSAWRDDDSSRDSDALRSARLKLREPLLHVTGRLLVEAAARPRLLALFGRTWGPVRSLNVPGARLVRSLLPSWLVLRQADSLALPLWWWPVRANSRELAGILALPVGEAPLPGVSTSSARQLPPVPGTPTTGTVLADSTYPGSERPLAISRRDRQMHTFITGPTGSGKSTILATIGLSDASNGDGMAILDAKGDMVTDILERLEQSRWDDVIVIDPSDVARPVSINVLSSADTETARELAVDQVVHIFRQQWADYWGPRTETVLRCGLLTLISTRAVDGSRFTLCELPELLNNSAFRRYVTSQLGVPASVRRFWLNFEALSEAEKRQWVGPVGNKLAAFTTRTTLRLLLGSSEGIDLHKAMQDRKLILVPLSPGVLGQETAELVGALLVSSIYQAGLARITLSAAQRRPWWLTIDEAQELVRLPIDMPSMLAVCRGLGIGITLGNQYLSQLPEAVRRAVISTVRSQVVFAVEPDDARVLARAFEPSLSERDLRGLPAFEVALRICVDGQTTRPMTGKTRPLGPPLQDAQTLRTLSRERYGLPRVEIERAMEARLGVDRGHGDEPFGRRERGSGATS